MENSGIQSDALSSLHAFAVPRAKTVSRILLAVMVIPSQPVVHVYGRKASSTAHKAHMNVRTRPLTAESRWRHTSMQPDGLTPLIFSRKTDNYETVHLSFDVDWSKEVALLLAYCSISVYA